ncbi:hypothetical protein M446_0808 [Methylobacterium sp. 4-46]|uniref:hypothetical protein n=1 Tax=unclassified Methylobacterium TaxID=2615210 RepID=UPI000152C626|nr:MULTISPECIES: hypothetical protein [Methylobacterium]ACA15362.1 hypothetical protein M446_0808 [Methylobacterium sp. 4-46]WFT81084.1 hypothetical protein QA634_04050 [Methylobacterium nodulans]
MSVVYHYTDTARLPWILRSGELRPGNNRIGGFPDPDFLWATTSPVGERTAAASMQALRAGLTRLVRFVLPAEGFDTWPEIVRAYPAWTREHVARLEHAAKGKSRPQDWRCRVQPLPAEVWLGIGTRSFTDTRWLPFDSKCVAEQFGERALGLWFGSKIYISEEVEHPSGATGYSVTVGTRRAA